MRTGELKQAFDVVMEIVGHWVSDGYRVETPLGSFAPKLKLLGEHTDPKTIHGRDIKYTGIEFIPSKEFVKECGKNREGYRKSQAPVGNSQMYDAQAMEEALRQSLKWTKARFRKELPQQSLLWRASSFAENQGKSPLSVLPFEGNCKRLSL